MTQIKIYSIEREGEKMISSIILYSRRNNNNKI